MPSISNGPITGLLQAAANGDESALGLVFERVYGELCAVAHRVRGGRAGDTLNTTALVHEAYAKLVPSELDWRSRAHFFAVAARAMRQILVDAARRRMTQKRGGAGDRRVTLDENIQAADMRPAQLLLLDDALARLDRHNSRCARVVDYRFFAGLSIHETALLLDVSTGTVERDWRTARAWLAAEIGENA